MQNKKNRTIAVRVFLQKKTLRHIVGLLKREKNRFIFEYDETYLNSHRPLALGPDLPLSKKQHRSSQLFVSFADRLPSRRNPAYSQYCKSMGIASNENDVIVLLSHIAYKGPSSFVFAPVYAPLVKGEDIKKWRCQMDLSLRELAAVFGFSPATLQGIENNKGIGLEAHRRLELYYLFPQAAAFELQRSFAIDDDKKELAMNHIKNCATF